MKEISAQELKEKLSAGEDIQLIDVREQYEHEAMNIGGILMPLSSLMEHADLIEKNKTVIVYCKKGIRSQIAIQRFSEKFGYNHLINLKGGLDAYIVND
jgi:adenylyltransferase/sulfurtransferase